jgi:hypothetical protein
MIRRLPILPLISANRSQTKPPPRSKTNIPRPRLLSSLRIRHRSLLTYPGIQETLRTPPSKLHQITRPYPFLRKMCTNECTRTSFPEQVFPEPRIPWFRLLAAWSSKYNASAIEATRWHPWALVLARLLRQPPNPVRASASLLKRFGAKTRDRSGRSSICRPAEHLLRVALHGVQRGIPGSHLPRGARSRATGTDSSAVFIVSLISTILASPLARDTGMEGANKETGTSYLFVWETSVGRLKLAFHSFGLRASWRRISRYLIAFLFPNRRLT